MGLVSEEEFYKLKLKIESLENKVLGHYSEVYRMLNETADSNRYLEQAQTQFGLYTALCIGTIDIWKQNRIKFYTPIFHRPDTQVTQLPYAHAVSSMGGFDDCGLTWVPPAGSTIVLLFEHGDRNCPYYIGTVWHRNRGAFNSNQLDSTNSPQQIRNFGYPIKEFQDIWEGKRTGYLVGPNDGSQVFPPWNTENYNGFDLDSINDFATNPEAQRLITYPHIYGFKTPEKHMIKMVDGDPKCNRKWKRFEIMSSRGNWIMMKDDHLHYAGQWANPKCGGSIIDGITSCVEDEITQEQIFDATNGNSSENPFVEVNDVTPKSGKKYEETSCQLINQKFNRSNKKIIGGHPNTGHEETKYSDKSSSKRSQIGANPYFKNEYECRPYRGAGTPQNNICDLPQTGIQIMSISGHTFLMDDSVEEPSGDPTFDKEFDFGCNDKYVGRTYWKSATGHSIEMSDVESPEGEQGSNLRGEYNYIRLLSATGNKIELNDHTVSQPNCVGCPPNTAGNQRGIHLQSTSNHTIDMVDEGNEQCSPCRREGGTAIPKAKKAFVRIRTGYGLEMLFNDESSQEITQSQHIQIFCPQKDNEVRGQHIMRFQEAPTGPGLVFLRVGGNYYCQTYDAHVTVVGDPELNPSDLEEIVTRDNIVFTQEIYLNICETSHVFYAKDSILLLAGRDASPPDDPLNCNNGCGGESPSFGSVLVYDYCTGCIRISDRVFASTSGRAQAASIFMMHPFNKGCSQCPSDNENTEGNE